MTLFSQKLAIGESKNSKSLSERNVLIGQPNWVFIYLKKGLKYNIFVSKYN